MLACFVCEGGVPRWHAVRDFDFQSLVMILIPIKNLDSAKQRLAAALDQPARTQLAQAMLRDELEAIASWDHHPAVALVTSDPYARDLAGQFHFDVIPDDANRGETDAIEMATQVCIARGADYTLVIPGDIPLMQAHELKAIFNSAPAAGSVLVTAADGRGTNAVLRRPANLFPLRFGNDSFKPHLAAAQATQKPCIVLSLPGIALDIDNPVELRQLASLPGEARAQRLARQWGFAAVPRAVCHPEEAESTAKRRIPDEGPMHYELPPAPGRRAIK